MQLVGAPLAYVRGPFVAEGVLQGGGGAVLAILRCGWWSWQAGRALARWRRRPWASAHIAFLPVHLCLALVFGGMLLGCVAGVLVARGAPVTIR